MKLRGRFCHYWDNRPKVQRLSGGTVVSARRLADGTIRDLTVEDASGARRRVPREWFKIRPDVSGFTFRRKVYTIEEIERRAT